MSPTAAVELVGNPLLNDSSSFLTIVHLDTLCQSNCREDNPCGAQNPTRINATSTTSSASSATGTNGAAGGGAVNGFNAAEPTSSSGSSGNGGGSNAGVSAMDLGQSYGLAVIFTGIFAGFALVM